MTCGLATAALIAVSLASGGSVRIATEGAYPPFSLFDEAGTLTGFDVDVGKAVCDHAGLDCDWVTADFDRLIPGVVAGEFDLVIASLARTAGRAEVVDFTETYWSTTGTDDFLGRPGAPAIADALTGVQSGTIHADHLAQTGRRFQTFTTMDDVADALIEGRVDLAYGGWDPDLLAKMSDSHGIEPLYQETLESDGLYMAVCKGNDGLRDDLDQAIAALWDDGTIVAIAERWLY